MSTRSSISLATKFTEQDRQHMARALELARRGAALAHPNPMVGAVIVKHGIVVGEGFHKYDDRDHAEVVALRHAGEKAWGGTLYLNFEPCCTTGRTGPCTSALISAKLKHVFGAMDDPNPAVCGRGYAALERAGIGVSLGLCEAEAKKLNEDFAKWITTALPFVTMKVATTLDGQIAVHASETTPITGEASRSASHRMRHQADALLTGIGTILADNPQLTDRSGEPRRRKLLRVVLDSKLRLPLRSHLVLSGKGDILVYTTQPVDSPRARALGTVGVEVIQLPAAGERVDLQAVVRDLGQRQIINLMVEAGSEVNGSLLAAGLVDKVALFYAPKFLGADGVPLARTTAKKLTHLPGLANVTVESYPPDILVQGYFRDVYASRRKRETDRRRRKPPIGAPYT
ncbi:MAG TPA: bifunctional diaminohydroxyphosphoribosylaminopyrimidine deaminase/5-amino-6-(5-phosphoribosylamino)uracil reductase RibD [Candidatus Acidoferrales bacterium]|nr:bifunctional diaminohydroxyphosphoribosylaminopyrimidine deaminase/5-amino-6-(5-phosphoribosylamino)uracil reductase RibD [Candidatus Acidoferrales bacterium]